MKWAKGIGFWFVCAGTTSVLCAAFHVDATTEFFIGIPVGAISTLYAIKHWKLI